MIGLLANHYDMRMYLGKARGGLSARMLGKPSYWLKGGGPGGPPCCTILSPRESSCEEEEGRGFASSLFFLVQYHCDLTIIKLG